MLENDLRAMFEWQASADQPPAQISFPVARRRSQLHRRWRRAATLGSPIVAAAAAVAIGLTASLASGTAGTRPAPARPTGPEAPRRFNPLVPYAAAGWYPDRNKLFAGSSYPTALEITAWRPARGPRAFPWSNIVVYAGGQCVLESSRLSCGSTAAGTSAVLTLSGRAPAVRGHAAYWVRSVSGELNDDGKMTGAIVAFQYARGGWATVDFTGAAADTVRADTLRIAANLRYGQTVPVWSPIRLTSMPRAWREIQEVGFGKNGSRWQVNGFTLGHHGALPGNLAPPPDSVSLNVYIGEESPVPCSNLASCRVTVINGYQVTLYTVPPFHGFPTGWYALTATRADGLVLDIDVAAPRALLSPAAIFARHLELLGADPAHWTRTPISP